MWTAYNTRRIHLLLLWMVGLWLTGCHQVKTKVKVQAKDAHWMETFVAAQADQHLQPGDILFLYEETPKDFFQGVISTGQSVLKRTYHSFQKRFRESTPYATHVAMYVGHGILAEAEGTHPGNARVRLQTLDVHGGTRFLVYRSRSRKLATAAARIAVRWANQRIRYKIPAHLLFYRPTFNQKARETALRYGQYADQAGGPPRVKAMFCSQFVWAAYQAAIVAPQLKANPKLAAKDLKMPQPLALYADNLSPMTMTGHFQTTTQHPQGFRQRLDFRVDPKARVQRDFVKEDWLHKLIRRVKRPNTWLQALPKRWWKRQPGS